MDENDGGGRGLHSGGVRLIHPGGNGVPGRGGQFHIGDADAAPITQDTSGQEREYEGKDQGEYQPSLGDSFFFGFILFPPFMSSWLIESDTNISWTALHFLDKLVLLIRQISCLGDFSVVHIFMNENCDKCKKEGRINFKISIFAENKAGITGKYDEENGPVSG